MNKNFGVVFGELLGLVITILVLNYLVPSLSFITKDYIYWLPIATVTAIISTVIDILKHLVKENYFYLVKSFSNIPDLFSIYFLIQIFPINFEKIGYPIFNTVFYYGLIISLIVISINVVLNFKKYFFK